MAFIVNNIKWIMLIAGLATCSMILSTLNPELGLANTFGAEMSDPVDQIVVRNWGALITLVGACLIYGAFNPQVRSFTLVIACISKLIFISLVLMFGAQFMDKALVPVIFDTVVVALFVLYLISAKQEA